MKKFLKIKDIYMGEDDRDSNKKIVDGRPVYKQSKCTCKFLLEDKEGQEYVWVVENQSLAEAIEKIGLNEEEKYGNYFSSNGVLLGRYMFFLSWLYEFYEKFLTKFGFKPNQKDLDKARRFKHGKYKN